MESAKIYQLPVEKIIGMHMSPTDWPLLVKTVDRAIQVNRLPGSMISTRIGLEFAWAELLTDTLFMCVEVNARFRC
jgi:hypothetical protein